MAISLFLIGFFMMINRRKALTQVLALLSLENGLFLAAISLTYGMPLIVELGVFFDVLVAVMVLGILVYRIRETFESMDVSRLRRLRADDPCISAWRPAGRRVCCRRWRASAERWKRSTWPRSG